MTSLHQQQVEAYYTLLLKRVGIWVRVPVPLRGNPIPSDEDYNNSRAIWNETRELLTMMGIEHTSISKSFGIRIDK